MRNILQYFILIESIQSKPPLRIIGGRDAEIDEFPYVVRLEVQIPITKANNRTVIRSRHLCTGSVISPSWTVSAAHCLQYFNELIKSTKRKQTLVIRHGSVNATPSETDAFSKVDYYIYHHAYRLLKITNLPKSNMRIYNDVALVHHQPVLLKQYGKVAGLDFTSLSGHEVTFAGYGLTHGSQGSLINTLDLKKPLQVLSGILVQCPPNKHMYPALCISRRCGQDMIDSTCGGDSGGPVIHPAGIVAVISKGIKCLPDWYAVPVPIVSYVTPLSPYIQWISDHLGNS